MNQRPFFNPQNFHPPPRNFHPPSQRAPFNPRMNMPINQNQQMNRQMPNHMNQGPNNMNPGPMNPMRPRGFMNVNERPRMMPQIFPQQRPQRSDEQMQMQQQQMKRPLHPPEPPRFSDFASGVEEQKSPPINPSYKAAIDEELKKLEIKLKDYLRDPELHPFYGKEWQLFWNRKADELAKRGEDPADYDFKDEWCEFFIDRIHELHDEEVKWKVEQIQRKFGMSDCEYPALKKIRLGSVERDEPAANEHESDENEDYAQCNEQSTTEQNAPWKMTDMQEKPRKSRFDQPPAGFSGQNIQFPVKQLGLVDPNQNFRQMGLVNPPPYEAGTSNYMPDANTAPKKPKRNLDKILVHTLKTIQLEDVPLSMKVHEILDFFGNKFRGIVGCFRATDYIAKLPSRIVYMILMDDKEVDTFEKMREIYMDGNYVKISTVKLLSGSAVADPNVPEVPGAPQSVFLTHLEKRNVETTFYMREIAKFFEAQFAITGIRICHNAKSRKSRNFAFVNFLSKASVNEFDGRTFKMFEYEIRCSKTPKIPLLISIDHADALNEENTVPWNAHIRELNLLNVDL